nr:TonB-dependent receptor [Leadbetterella sp.]
VLTELATVKPEAVRHLEFGIKTKPSASSVFNVVFHNTDIKDYQTQVQTPEPGVNRGYLANAEQVRVIGFEVDGNIRINNHFTFNGAFAYTDGKYVKFTNAPVPIEEVGGPSAFKDISGGQLPGISKYAGSLGTEITGKGSLFGLKGNYFGGLDVYYRSTFSSSPSPSEFLDIEGYTLLNGRVGFRASNGISLFVWGRNLGNKDYYEQLLVAPGSAGQIGGILGDPRTYGVTLRYTLN